MTAARDSQTTGQSAERAVLAALEAGAVLEKKRFEGNLAYVTARGPSSLLNRFSRFRERA